MLGKEGGGFIRKGIGNSLVRAFHFALSLVRAHRLKKGIDIGVGTHLQGIVWILLRPQDGTL